MVLIKNRVRSVILPLAVTSLMFLNGCKEEEVEPTPKFSTDLLIGEWTLTEADGEDYTNDESSLHIKFETSGVVGACREYVAYPDYNYCGDVGKWKWENANQEAIILTDENDVDEAKWDIIILDETRLEGNVTDADETYTTSFKFIKVI
jgi:hypothetical protein